MVTKKSAEQDSAPSSEVETPAINWGAIDTMQEAHAALETAYGAVLSSSKLFGDGSEFIRDKEKLVGVPLMILDWRFIVDEETGREYVNVLVMNQQGNKARFNDGSTGVYEQLKSVTDQYGVIGITCKFGLRKSEYTKEVDGKKEKAVTYYLSA